MVHVGSVSNRRMTTPGRLQRSTTEMIPPALALHVNETLHTLFSTSGLACHASLCSILTAKLWVWLQQVMFPAHIIQIPPHLMVTDLIRRDHS